MGARLRRGCEEGRQAASSRWKRPGTASLSLREGSSSTVLRARPAALRFLTSERPHHTPVLPSATAFVATCSVRSNGNLVASEPFSTIWCLFPACTMTLQQIKKRKRQNKSFLTFHAQVP